MARLLDSIDRAQSDPEKDIHFALELRRLFDSIERGENLRGYTATS